MARIIPPGYTVGRRPRPTGVVYVLGPLAECHKIGHTTDIKKRFESYAGLPSKVELVHRIPTLNARWLEGFLHRAFSPKHTRGEWFRLGPDDLALLMTCSRADAEHDLPREIVTLHYANPAFTRDPRQKKLDAAAAEELRRGIRESCKMSGKNKALVAEAASHLGVTVDEWRHWAVKQCMDEAIATGRVIWELATETLIAWAKELKANDWMFEDEKPKTEPPK